MFIDEKEVINKIEKLISPDILDVLIEHEAFIAGGLLTSILSNSKVNDIDVFFKNKESFLNVLNELILHQEDESSKFDLIYLGHSDKAVTFKQNHYDNIVQFVYDSYYENVVDVFEDFDYTINMFAYDLENDRILQGKNALYHLAQRKLFVNTKTKYPFVSVFRLDKYIKRGYKIQKNELIKLLLACNKHNIDSYESLSNNIGGDNSINNYIQ